jgi:hypothetical protein
MQPLGPITEAFRIINYAEAALWAAIGAAFAIQSFRRGGATRLTCLVAAIVLLAFGASDVVETRTGAWWHPWWLLAWKAACVLALLALVIQWWRASRRTNLPR